MRARALQKLLKRMFPLPNVPEPGVVPAEVPRAEQRHVEVGALVGVSRPGPAVASDDVTVDEVGARCEADVVELEARIDRGQRSIELHVALLLVEHQSPAKPGQARGCRVDVDVVLVGALEVVDASFLQVGHANRGAGDQAAPEPAGKHVPAVIVEEGPPIHAERVGAAVHLVRKARLVEEALRDRRDEADALRTARDVLLHPDRVPAGERLDCHIAGRALHLVVRELPLGQRRQGADIPAAHLARQLERAKDRGAAWFVHVGGIVGSGACGGAPDAPGVDEVE